MFYVYKNLFVIRSFSKSETKLALIIEIKHFNVGKLQSRFSFLWIQY